jgi:hypothetical protein
MPPSVRNGSNKLNRVRSRASCLIPTMLAQAVTPDKHQCLEYHLKNRGLKAHALAGGRDGGSLA